MKKRKPIAKKKRRKPNLFERVGFTKGDYDVTALILAVVVCVSSDAHTKLKCDHALKSLRRLKRVVAK